MNSKIIKISHHRLDLHPRRLADRRQTSTNNPKKARCLFLSLLFFVAVLSLANIVFSCQLATSGEKMKILTEETRQLGKTNEGLQKRVVEVSSYTQVSLRAAKLGFQKASTVIYLKGQPPLAMR